MPSLISSHYLNLPLTTPRFDRHPRTSKPQHSPYGLYALPQVRVSLLPSRRETSLRRCRLRRPVPFFFPAMDKRICYILEVYGDAWCASLQDDLCVDLCVCLGCHAGADGMVGEDLGSERKEEGCIGLGAGVCCCGCVCGRGRCGGLR